LTNHDNFAVWYIIVMFTNIVANILQFYRNMTEELGRRRWEIRVLPQPAAQTHTVWIVCFCVIWN